MREPFFEVGITWLELLNRSVIEFLQPQEQLIVDMMKAARNESIFNLVVAGPTAKQKGELFRSKFDPAMPPTGSTLGLKNCSSSVSNLNGNPYAAFHAHSPYKSGANWGPNMLPSNIQKRHRRKQNMSSVASSMVLKSKLIRLRFHFY